MSYKKSSVPRVKDHSSVVAEAQIPALKTFLAVAIHCSLGVWSLSFVTKLRGGRESKLNP